MERLFSGFAPIYKMQAKLVQLLIAFVSNFMYFLWEMKGDFIFLKHFDSLKKF